MKRRLSLMKLLLAFASLILTYGNSFAQAEENKIESGFTSLFDGKTLDGWEGNTKLWSVEDGAITGEINGKDKTTPGNTFLISKQSDVTNFELRLSYKIVGHNSGIQYRGKVLDKKNFVVGGYQADLEAGMPNDKGVREDVFSGMNYDERGRGPLAQRGERTTIDENGKVIQREKIGDFKELAKKLNVDDWNDYVVIAVGNKLQHFINGQLMSEVIDDHEAKRAMSGVLAFQLHAGPPMKVQFKNIRIRKIEQQGSKTVARNASTTIAKLAPELEPGFTSLFDGKTLDGWEGNTKLWSVENGAIVGEIDGKEKSTKGNTFLIWKGGDVADFELRLQFRIEGNNSGIQYRSKIVNKQQFVIGGYQADFEVGEKYSGILYEEKGRGILAERGQRTTIDEKGKVQQREPIGDAAELGKKVKKGEWNDYKIIAVGNKLQHYINDQLMCEVIDDQKEKSARAELSLEYKVDTRALSGLLALQLHAGPPMKVEFKNIRLKNLAPTGTKPTPVETLSTDESGFKPIFNGKTLDGWEGNTDLWRVEDGSIVGETTKENKIRNNTFLVWKEGQADDFELRFQYKLRNHNTGIQYRSSVIDDKKWIVKGYQCDLVVPDKGVGGVEDYTGLCWYEAGDRGVLGFRSQRTTVDKDGYITQREKIDNKEKLAKLIKIGDWNDVAIVCKGSKIQQFINGQLMCEVIDEQADRRVLDGVLALQLHVGPPMKVEFKNIRLKRLKLAAVEPVGKRAKLVMVAGKPSHGPGAHEFNAGTILLKKCLAEGMPQIVTSIYKDGWPTDPTAFDNADAIMLYMDGGDEHPVVQKNRLAEIDYLTKKGVGLVCTHYAVEVPQEKGGPDFLKWIGGYFEENWSVNPHWTAEMLELPHHAITSGVEKFKMHDEWYFHMRFVPEMKSVTPILTAVPTPDTMKRKDGPHEGNPTVRAAVKDKVPQHLAWAYERADGGRGFGYTGAHNHKNWGDDNNRKLFLNALVWACKLDVPTDGVKSTVTEEDLAKNLDEKGQRKRK